MPSEITQKATVAKNLRDQRKRKGWSQEKLSESSGVAVRTIQRIENAKVEPHLQTLALLAGSLELEVHELLSGGFAEDEKLSGASERKWLLMFHLSPLIGFIIPFGNIIVPLILWAYKRSDHPIYDEHGRAVINFHLTVSLAFLLGVFLLLMLFEVGLILLILISIFTLSQIILNTQKMLKDETFKYPLVIKFL